MEYGSRPNLLDADGRPLDERVQRALTRLMPRFRRRYPAIANDLALTEVFEEAGRRIADRERRHGAIEKLQGYAWVTLRSVATSWMRRASNRLTDRTLPSAESEAVLRMVPAPNDATADVERQILLREVLELLNEDERMVCVWKKAGFSSEEIAAHRGGSAAAVDTLFSRAKQKIRVALGHERTSAAGRPGAESSTPPTAIKEAHVRPRAAS